MTDEGQAFFSELIAQGFTAEQALDLTMTWLFGTSGGKQA